VGPDIPARLVTVTDTRPIVQSIERQTGRFDVRVAQTARQVDDISASVNKSVEEAIRSGDSAREIQAKDFQRQMMALKTLADTAAATSRDLQEDSLIAHAELAKASSERDAALRDRESIRQQMLSNIEDSRAALARMDERRIAEETRANEWRKRTLATWGALGAIAALSVALKVFKYI
jgi:hypothetical protein